MTRDYAVFPDDATGDVLWGMSQQGDDLEQAREVEFAFLFASEENALKFGELLLFNRQKVMLSDNEDSAEYPYEILVSVSLVPHYQDIIDYQALLMEHAAPLQGLSDGWCSQVQH